MCAQKFSSVLETKTTVDSSECRVRSLQMSILCELKQLQQYLSLMEEQFKEIEESVKNSVLDTDGKRHFRDKILSVAKDLRSFQAGVANHFVNDCSESVMVKEEIPEEMQLEPGEINSNWLEDFISTFPIPSISQMNPKIKSKDKSIKKNKATPKTKVGSKTKKSGRKATNKTAELPETESDVIPKASRKRSKQRIEREMSEIEESAASPMDSTEEYSVVSNEQDCSLVSGRRSHRSEKPTTASYLDYDDEREDDEGDGDSDYDPGVSPRKKKSNDGDDEGPKPKKKRKLLDPSTYSSGEDPLANVDITEMDPFKRCMILMVLNRPPIYVTDNEDEEEIVPGSPEYYFQEFQNEMRRTWFEFDEKNGGTVHFKGIDILINSEEKTLKCSRCPYTMKFKWPPNKKGDRVTGQKIRKLRRHVPRHLDGFECPFCPPRARQKTCKPYNSTTYAVHLRGHCSKQRFICEICSKGFHERPKLDRHVLIHKSREERREITEKKMRTGDFMCEFCPRACETQLKLDAHIRMAHPGVTSTAFTVDEQDKPKRPTNSTAVNAPTSLERKLLVLEMHFKNPKWKLKTLGKFCPGLTRKALCDWRKKYSHYFKKGRRVGDSNRDEAISQDNDQESFSEVNTAQEDNGTAQESQMGIIFGNKALVEQF